MDSKLYKLSILPYFIDIFSLYIKTYTFKHIILHSRTEHVILDKHNKENFV